MSTEIASLGDVFNPRTGPRTARSEKTVDFVILPGVNSEDAVMVYCVTCDKDLELSKMETHATRTHRATVVRVDSRQSNWRKK